MAISDTAKIQDMLDQEAANLALKKVEKKDLDWEAANRAGVMPQEVYDKHEKLEVPLKDVPYSEIPEAEPEIKSDEADNGKR